MQTIELTKEVTTVFQAAKSLPPKEREQLAEELWASLDEDAPCEVSELEAMQLEEVRRRLEEVGKRGWGNGDRGQVQFIQAAGSSGRQSN